MNRAHNPDPPTWRLLTLDIAGLIGATLTIAFITALVAMPGFGRMWLTDHFKRTSERVTITATVADGVSPEVVMSELAQRLPLIYPRLLDEEKQRERLSEFGVDIDTLDPYVLDAIPQGFTFRVEDLHFNRGHVRSVFNAMTRTGDVAFHWDRNRFMSQHPEPAKIKQGRVHSLTCFLAILAIAALCLAMGHARLGVHLEPIQIVQALMARMLVTASLGYMLGCVLVLIVVAMLDAPRGDGLLPVTMWIIPAAMLVSPIGILRR